MKQKRDTREARAARRRRTMTVRVVKSHEEIAEFNRDFWRRAGHEARFAAAWDMVNEVRRMRGQRGSQLRLQRSLALVESREG